jgi:hypothetical protein
MRAQSSVADFSKNILSTPLIDRVVVRDVIDQGLKYVNMSDEDMDSLFAKGGYFADVTSKSTFKKQLKMAPRNTVIGVNTTSQESEPKIYYPFFSQHLSLPVKPGETVWVIDAGLFNDFSVSDLGFSHTDAVVNDKRVITALPSEKLCSGYWMSRVSSPIYVEDPNFVHQDREKEVQSAFDCLGTQPEDLDFPNGIFRKRGGLGAQTQQVLRSGFDYDTIYEKSDANKRVTRDPVPNFNKRPGDLVIQGSNNTLISLGEDRPPVEDADSNISYLSRDESSKPRKLEKRGTIDIVAGRSLRIQDTDTVFNENQVTIASNTRDEEEKDSRTFVKSQGKSVVKEAEGDPNYVDDLSRVMISMRTSGDAFLGISETSSLPNPGSALSPVENSPYIVLKSNETRIISREQGSLRIIKEGERTSETDPGSQAVITMQPDGTIMIDGPKIIVGSGNAKGNGQGDQVLIGGSSASEPIVLGNALKGIIGELIDAISALTVPTGVGPSGPPVNATQFSGIRGRLDTILSQVGKTK